VARAFRSHRKIEIRPCFRDRSRPAFSAAAGARLTAVKLSRSRRMVLHAGGICDEMAGSMFITIGLTKRGPEVTFNCATALTPACLGTVEIFRQNARMRSRINQLLIVGELVARCLPVGVCQSSTTRVDMDMDPSKKNVLKCSLALIRTILTRRELAVPRSAIYSNKIERLFTSNARLELIISNCRALRSLRT